MASPIEGLNQGTTIFEEVTEGRSLQLGTGGVKATKVYLVQGAYGPHQVELDSPIQVGDAYVDDDYPATNFIMYCTSVDIQNSGDGRDDMYTVTYSYSQRNYDDRGIRPKSPSDGDEYNVFEPTGEMVNIKSATYGQSKFPATAPDHGPFIGVDEDGAAEGVEVLDNSETLTVTKFMSAASYTTSYINGVRAIQNTVNSGPWYGTTEKEALFIGMSKVSYDEAKQLYELEFRFKISKSVAEGDLNYVDKNGLGITVTGGKKGWQYLWAKPLQTADDGNGGRRKVAVAGVYVADVYKSDTFSALGLSGLQ